MKFSSWKSLFLSIVFTLTIFSLQSCKLEDLIKPRGSSSSSSGESSSCSCPLGMPNCTPDSRVVSTNYEYTCANGSKKTCTRSTCEPISSSSSSGEDSSCACPLGAPNCTSDSRVVSTNYEYTCANGGKKTCTRSTCEPIGSSSSSGGGNLLPCTGPCPVGAIPPPHCPEGKINVWFGPPPEARLPTSRCLKPGGGIQECFGFAYRNEKHSFSECRVRCGALGEASSDLDQMDEEEYKTKCGGDDKCEVKGSYNELCWDKSSPSPQPRSYRSYFSCYSNQAVKAECYLGASQGLLRGNVCQWKTTTALTNCLKTKVEEERKAKLREFQNDSNFGCKLLKESLTGRKYIFNFECTPSFNQNPSEYCAALLTFAEQTIPPYESIRQGTLFTANGVSTRATFKILNATSGDSIKTFPQCNDYFQPNPIE